MTTTAPHTLVTPATDGARLGAALLFARTV